ncbi:RNA-directed DNA polymerase, eukaryota [Tanacetum coccineum]|uniref:RNA-directed DNA polymerase, eukaryota n=1 Tax=Tanacetum coccineum TaxID=301880 RepID=A0ABQ5FI83_9ASTR
MEDLTHKISKSGFTIRETKSKEDEVLNISTSIFVTNFPEKFSAKDLWESCSLYGTVIDSYIPNRRANTGKRFGFVRFIKAHDVERLINNLCTIWIGSFKLHANIAKFQRPPVNKNVSQSPKQNQYSTNPKEHSKVSGLKRNNYSYAYDVQTGSHHHFVRDDKPAIVLEESCINQREFTLAVMGKVKEFGSLSNLKLALANEGFENILLRYLGGYWVMTEFHSTDTKKKFMANVGVSSWFSIIQQASNDFLIDERVTWVDLEGIPLKVWSLKTFERIASKWGELLFVEDQKESCFSRKRICIKTKFQKNILESFKIINSGKVFWVRASEAYGWVPDFVEEEESDCDTDEEASEGEVQENNVSPHNLATMEGDSDGEEIPNNIPKQTQPQVHQEVLKDNKSGERNKNNDIKDKRVHTNNLSTRNVKEAREESVCSGHFKHTEIPHSGGSIIQVMDDLVKIGATMGYNMEGCIKNIKDIIGILCTWDPRVFRKDNATISDYFVLLRGVWLSNGKQTLIIAIYAPQELSEKEMLWEYLLPVIRNWSGVVMFEGSFPWGSPFTWSHKSGAKMSKLDRFLVSKRFIMEHPGVSAVTLDRYISDHRPILLRDSQINYGPIPFHFFHSWFEFIGFDELVETTWNEYHHRDTNAIRYLNKKLKHLKGHIHAWIHSKKDLNSNQKKNLKAELATIDDILDKDKEGDENSKYYHGILNKKRSQLAIRGVLVDGIWIENPTDVKQEFLSHFKNRFDLPVTPRICLDMDFPNVLSHEQQNDVVAAVGYFFQYGDFPKGGNPCFIALIPKVSDANMVKDFRPITLIGSVASGLHINMNKSKLLGIAVDTKLVDQAANKIGCTTIKTPFSYLGSTVGRNMSQINSWEEIIRKVESRLSIWKLKTLSIGGRLTLLKSVLGSIPIYHMSLFKVPKTVLHRLEAIRCCFFHGKDSNSRKPTWLKWNKILASKEKGGLGVSSFFSLNKALICKWVWRFCSQNSSLWAKIWIDIVREVHALRHLDSVATMLSRDHFSQAFRRAPRGGKDKSQLNALSSDMGGVLLSNMSDRWTWTLEGLGEFSVASLRRLIDKHILPDVASKTRWIFKVPIKINIHAWKVKLDGLPTRLNISKRGILIDSFLCPSCETAVESSSHTFFQCKIATDLLRMITRWWNVPYVDISSYEEWLEWFKNLCLQSKYKQLFEGVCYIAWSAHYELDVSKLSNVDQDSRANERHPMLERGNYIPWESRFRSFLDNKLEEGERMWNSFQNGPYVRPMISDQDGAVNINAKEGESLESVYERLTMLVNIMDHNNVRPIPVSNNTKFLNCLQLEWSKYVTMVRHNQAGETVSYDMLYDSLVQFEPRVLASKAKKAAKNHDPLALIAHSHASSSQSYANSSYLPQPYYVTHPSSVVDYEDEYQGELQGDSQEDKLTTAMMMVELTYKPRMQVMVEMVIRMQGDKAGIKRLMQEMEMMTAIRLFSLFYELSQLWERQIEQMLLAMKDEARSNLNSEENDFMLDTSYGEETMEELTAAVMLMARIQPTDGNAETLSSYDAKAVSENHERLKKAIAAQQKMYDGEKLHSAKLIIDSQDSEETLEDAEESRLKMRNKMV